MQGPSRAALSFKNASGAELAAFAIDVSTFPNTTTVTCTGRYRARTARRCRPRCPASTWCCVSAGAPTSRLISGAVDYQPQPLDRPAEGNLLICCSRPTGDLVIDL